MQMKGHKVLFILSRKLICQYFVVTDANSNCAAYSILIEADFLSEALDSSAQQLKVKFL